MRKEQIIKLFKAIWRSTGYSFIIVIMVALTIKSAIADWYIVPTGSMKPTIVEGDRIFVNKLAYDLKIPFTMMRIARWDSPDRGDIAVFYSPKDGIRLVKRVIGVPGDTVSMINNRLIINGKPVVYIVSDNEQGKGMSDTDQENHIILNEYLNQAEHAIMLSENIMSIRSFPQFTIPKGKYFMMGDNRDNSADSRYFGLVDRESVIGKALSIVISLNASDYYKPRWERFFNAL